MEPIVRILVEVILVFAYCREDQMAEDFSVIQLERIAQSLGSTSEELIQQFVEVVQRMAGEARLAGDEERMIQLEEMPVHLGLR